VFDVRDLSTVQSSEPCEYVVVAADFITTILPVGYINSILTYDEPLKPDHDILPFDPLAHTDEEFG